VRGGVRIESVDIPLNAGAPTILGLGNPNRYPRIKRGEVVVC
jgi:hypothetical protein